jgi:hypothetical protein
MTVLLCANNQHIWSQNPCSLDNRPVPTLIPRIHLRHILLSELEVAYIRVLREVRRIARSHHRRPLPLQTIANEYLLCCLTISVGDDTQSRIICPLVAHDGAIRLDGDFLPVTECDELFLLVPWVKLCVRHTQWFGAGGGGQG